MARDIDDYRRKRDFGRTPEPPADGLRRAAADRAVFVVHRHEARRVHYDLRLEMEGVLRSWAIPKGFSYDPAVKHLAVRTEDHPLAYEDFHGWIPRGEYGAGRMIIWDRGRFAFARPGDGPRAVDEGELKILLFGRRLRGEWHLVKTKQGPDTWLCFKTRDRYAGPELDSALGLDLAAASEAPLPSRPRPALAAESAAPFDDPDWLFEVELAGRRVFVDKRGDDVRLSGGTRLDPGIGAALQRLRAERARLEGVLAALDAQRRPDAGRLEAWLAREEPADLALFLFDLLHWEDYDLRALPLLERKRALRAVLPADPGPLVFVDHVLGDCSALARAAAAEGISGLIAKRAAAPARAGATGDWKRVPLAGLAPRAPAPRARTRTRPRVTLTNLDKVFWPAEGFTKGDLVGYVEAVAETVLPHLAGRPVHLVRFPDGIDGKSFYQRHPPEGFPDWIDTVEFATREGGQERFVLLHTRDALVWTVNAGAIEWHPWMSRAASPDEPDWMVLDLDAKQSRWEDVLVVARRSGALLTEIGLRPYLKTSGKSGLHVYLPLARGYSYAQSRMFCEGIARAVARELPDIATVERVPAHRGARVYLDFGQNGREQTVVAPYSVRPVPGATVSTPLDWGELSDDLRREAFTLRTVPRRIEERGDLFAPVLTDRQDLGPAIERLAERVREDRRRRG